jgi:hypothetical protein
MIIVQGLIKLEKVADPEVATFLFSDVTGNKLIREGLTGYFIKNDKSLCLSIKSLND